MRGSLPILFPDHYLHICAVILAIYAGVFAQERFEAIRGALAPFLRTCGFRDNQVQTPQYLCMHVLLHAFLTVAFIVCWTQCSAHKFAWLHTAAQRSSCSRGGLMQQRAQHGSAAKAVSGDQSVCCACDVQVQWLPAVGPAGENLVRAPEEPRLAAWWRGPCVLGAVDAFAPPARNVGRPLRLPVAEVGKGARGGTAVSGKLEAGALRVCRVPHD